MGGKVGGVWRMGETLEKGERGYNTPGRRQRVQWPGV